jgi:phage terminase large subunit-like protein
LPKGGILLPYQKEWLLNSKKYPVSIWEKSRRIGASWVVACEAVMNASKKNHPVNTYYISYEKDMTMQFIKDCTFFAKFFQSLIKEIYKEKIIDDFGKDALIFRIRFSNGCEIASLSSNSRNLRSKKGNVVIDEAAFVDDLEEVLKAAIALTIWGGQIKILSTHQGKNNRFNKLVFEGRENTDNYVQKTSFMDAIDQGLYERLCLSGTYQNIKEEKQKFINKIYNIYKDNADEELDVKPREESALSVFRSTWFIISSEIPTTFDYLIRAWDTAATDKDDSCYTVGTLLGLKGQQIYILEWDYIKASASETQEKIIQVARMDGTEVVIYVELEGGSQPILWLENSLQSVLKGYEIIGQKVIASKTMRAVLAAREARTQPFIVAETEWAKTYIETICEFTGLKKKEPLINDSVDSLSLGVNALIEGYNPLLV